MCHRANVFGLLTLGLWLNSCGLAPDPSPMQSLAPADPAQSYTHGSVVPAKAKLYTTPDAAAAPNCDIYTSLTLANGFVGPLSAMRNVLRGSCQVELETQDRAYNLKELTPQCGSRIYVGERIPQGEEEPIAVKVTDHRARVCRDIVPARIIIEEKYRDGESIFLYGVDVH